MDLISIVVPVYNVEKYLKKCVDSIINQTYKKLEIILVDDGSIDKSGKICDDYLKIDKRIKVIHKKNGGLSEARNVGIEKAKGKYIGLVDSDDFIKNDMYENLYKAIKEKNADLALCKVIDCYGKIPAEKNEKLECVSFTQEQAIRKVLEGEEISVHAVSKLYKIELFKQIKFEVGKMAEDAIIMIDLISKCKSIVYINKSEYYYIHRENSITTKKFNPKNGYDVIYAYTKNYQIIEEKYPTLIPLAKMRLCWANFFVLDSMVKSNYKVDKKIINYLKKNFWFILKEPHFTKSRKISIILLKINVNLYSIVAKRFYLKKRRLAK